MPALSPFVRAVKGEDGPELWITGEIGTDVVFGDVQRALTYASDQGSGTPVLNIYSHGGDLHDALAFYDWVGAKATKFTVRIWGTAMSAATIIAAAAGRENIEIASNAVWMIHNASGGTDEMRTLGDGSMVRIYRKLTGLSEKKITEMMAATTTLSAQEAVEMGFAGKVMKGELKLAAMYEAKPIEQKTIAMSEKKTVKVSLSLPKAIAAAFGGAVTAEVDVDQAVADQLTEKDAAITERDATIAELKKQIEALEAAKPEDKTAEVEALTAERDAAKVEAKAKAEEVVALEAKLKEPLAGKTVANNTKQSIGTSPGGKDEKTEFVGQVFGQMSAVQMAQHAAKLKAKDIKNN